MSELGARDYDDLATLIRSCLPDDPFFSLSRSTFPVRFALRKSKSRRGFCVRTHEGKMVAAVLWGEDFSLLESGLILLFHSFRVPKRVFARIANIFYAGSSLLWGFSPKFRFDSEILTLVVDVDHQGQGLATRLLSNLESVNLWARTLEAVPRAVEVYERNGFEIILRANGRVFLRRDAM